MAVEIIGSDQAMMNGYQFIASLVRSIAWPAAVFGSILLFRQKLTELLPLLRFKYKDLEASFRLAQAEKEAAGLPPSPTTPDTAPTPEEENKFKEVARISPRAAILEVRTDIEEAVRQLADAVGLLTPKVQSFLGLTRLLRSRGIIDTNISALLDDLRVLGNNAAHRADTQFTTDDAIRYRSLADQVIDRLNAIKEEQLERKK